MRRECSDAMVTWGSSSARWTPRRPRPRRKCAAKHTRRFGQRTCSRCTALPPCCSCCWMAALLQLPALLRCCRAGSCGAAARFAASAGGACAAARACTRLLGARGRPHKVWLHCCAARAGIALGLGVTRVEGQGEGGWRAGRGLERAYAVPQHL